MSADYRFSLDRPTQCFGTLGAALAPAPRVGVKGRTDTFTNTQSPAAPKPSTTFVPAGRATTFIPAGGFTVAKAAEDVATLLRNARPADVWTRDSEYASSARIVDYRQENCCSVAGGMRCEAPYMTFQMWDLNVTCDANSMGRYLFPMDRFIWAHGELRRLLANPPGPVDLTNIVPGDTEQNLSRLRSAHAVMVRDTEAWASWCVQIMRCVALARWSTNLRWGFVKSIASSTPNMDSLTFYMNERSFRFTSASHRFSSPAELREFRLGPTMEMTILRLPSDVWDYDQAGSDRGITRLPLAGLPIRPTKIPAQQSDFDPEGGAVIHGYPGSSTGSTQSNLGIYFELLAFEGDPALQGLKLEGYQWGFQDPPQGDRRFEIRSLPSPYAQVLCCAALAQDTVAFDFFAYITNGLGEWLRQYETLPEQFRILDPNELRTAMRGLLQARIDAAAAGVATAGGIITSIAAAINPIAGVVVGLLFAIAALIVRLAADLCIVLPEAPPWVAAPFLRFINTGLDGQGACDFETTDPGGAARIANTHVALIRGMAERGISPDDWFTVLDTIERNSPDIRGDGGGRNGLHPRSSLLPIAAAATAVLLILAVAKNKKEKIQ